MKSKYRSLTVSFQINAVFYILVSNLIAALILFNSSCFVCRLAKKHGLELVSKKGFHEYYEMNKGKGRGLLGKMQALEVNMLHQN